MDCCVLSSTGLNDIDANNITSDNITILSSLNVSGTNILLEINNIKIIINGDINNRNSDIIDINTNLSNINGFINYSSFNLNIKGTTKINFNVGTQLTTINTSGSSASGLWRIADGLPPAWSAERV